MEVDRELTSQRLLHTLQRSRHGVGLQTQIHSRRHCSGNETRHGVDRHTSRESGGNGPAGESLGNRVNAHGLSRVEHIGLSIGNLLGSDLQIHRIERDIRSLSLVHTRSLNRPLEHSVSLGHLRNGEMLGIAVAIPRNSAMRIQQIPVLSVIACLQLPLRGATTHILVTGGDGVVGSLGMATKRKL